MTTLQINDIEAESIVNTYGQTKIIEFIKTFKPKSRVYNNDVNSKLNALKSIKFTKTGNLQKAFSSLNDKLSQFGNINIEADKREYFDKKYVK